MKISKWKQFNESVSDTFSKQRDELQSSFNKEIDKKVEEMRQSVEDCLSDLIDVSKETDWFDESTSRFSSDNYYGVLKSPGPYFKQLAFTYFFEISDNEPRTNVLQALWESVNKLNSIDATTVINIDKGYDILFKFEGKDLTYNKISKAILSKKIAKEEFKIKIHIS